MNTPHSPALMNTAHAPGVKRLYKLTSAIGIMFIRATSPALALQSACADYLRGNGPVFHNVHCEAI